MSKGFTALVDRENPLPPHGGHPWAVQTATWESNRGTAANGVLQLAVGWELSLFIRMYSCMADPCRDLPHVHTGAHTLMHMIGSTHTCKWKLDYFRFIQLFSQGKWILFIYRWLLNYISSKFIYGIIYWDGFLCMLLSIRNDTINTSGELVFIKYSTYSNYNTENIMHSDAEEEGVIST